MAKGDWPRSKLAITLDLAPGQFLHDIRRRATRADFFAICTTHLDHAEPLSGTPVVA